MHERDTVLRRFRTRTARSPWGARLAAVTLALALVFALTPCCDVLGAPTVPDAHAAIDPAPADHDHGGWHAPGQDDPCAAWLDRSDALAGKTDNLVSFDGKVVHGAQSLPVPPAVSPDANGARLAHLPIPPPDVLYLRLARLIL
jgi:hypothetical protein